MLKLNSIAEPEYSEGNDLLALQECVDGPIQMLAIKKGMTAYCNEDGMLQGLNPSAYIPDFLNHLGFTGYLPMAVYGNVALTGDDKKLSKKQSDHVISEYKVWYEKLHQEDEKEEEEEEEEEEPAPKKNKVFKK